MTKQAQHQDPHWLSKRLLLLVLLVFTWTEISVSRSQLFSCLKPDHDAKTIMEADFREKNDNETVSPTPMLTNDPVAPLIPQEFWFTNKVALEDEPNQGIPENVNAIVSMYREAWHNPTAAVHVLTDPECRVFIMVGYPEILEWFNKEPSGAIRGMC